MAEATSDILEVRNLQVRFPVKKGILARTTGYITAVDDVSFDLHRGETLGIVGESGSGKSTIARVIAGLQKATAGTVCCRGRVAMVFQDPLGSLNPRMTIGRIVEDAHLLRLVGLDASALGKYPHEFSGGQRQRICIARALGTRPELLICDEAVSALDLSIRSQVLDLLMELKRQLGLSLLFITHDLGVAQHIADRLLVMQRGRLMEEGPVSQVLHAPKSAYTANLICAVPRICYNVR